MTGYPEGDSRLVGSIAPSIIGKREDGEGWKRNEVGISISPPMELHHFPIILVFDACNRFFL